MPIERMKGVAACRRRPATCRADEYVVGWKYRYRIMFGPLAGSSRFPSPVPYVRVYASVTDDELAPYECYSPSAFLAAFDPLRPREFARYSGIEEGALIA